MLSSFSPLLSTPNHQHQHQQNSSAMIPFLKSLAINLQRRKDETLLIAAALASSEQRRKQDLFKLQMANTLPLSSSNYSAAPSLSSLLMKHQHQQSQAPAPALQRQQQSQPTVTQTLKALGSTLRRRSDLYVDVLKMPVPTATSTPARKNKAVAENFPEKLFRMLQDLEEEGQSEIASFLAHGRAFAVHDIERFIREVMPAYFRQSKWSSFTRQLNLWGFLRTTSGPDAGGFYHELFLKGHPGLCTYMGRVGATTQGVDRRRRRSRVTQDRGASDPDFYSMAV
jgi:hypothetical protein